jgi:hypothetical protein
MKRTTRKLSLDTLTIRRLQSAELRRAGGALANTAVPCFPTDSEIAGGCTVTDDTCQCTSSISFFFGCGTF